MAMCRQLPTAMVLGCALQKRLRREIPQRKLASVSQELVKDGVLVNVSYPAVKEVEALYPEIKVVASPDGFVVRRNSQTGVLFNPDHIRTAYAGGLDPDEFKRIKDTVEKVVALSR